MLLGLLGVLLVLHLLLLLHLLFCIPHVSNRQNRPEIRRDRLCNTDSCNIFSLQLL